MQFNFLKSKNSKNCVSLKSAKIVAVLILLKFRQSKNVLRQSERSTCVVSENRMTMKKYSFPNTMKNGVTQKLVKIVLV